MKSLDDFRVSIITETEHEAVSASDTGDVVFNAPRPLLGHNTWRGDFCHGIFYATVNTRDEFAPDMIEENRKLDATILLPVTESALEQVVLFSLNEKYQAAYRKASDKIRKDAVQYHARKLCEKYSYTELKEMFTDTF